MNLYEPCIPLVFRVLRELRKKYRNSLRRICMEESCIFLGKVGFSENAPSKAPKVLDFAVYAEQLETDTLRHEHAMMRLNLERMSLFLWTMRFDVPSDLRGDYERLCAETDTLRDWTRGRAA